MRKKVLLPIIVCLVFFTSGCDRFTSESIEWTSAGQSRLSEIRQMKISDSVLWAGGIPVPGQQGLTKMDLSTGVWTQITSQFLPNHSTSSIIIDKSSLIISSFGTVDQAGSISISPDLGTTWTEQPVLLPDSADPRCLVLPDTSTLIVGSVNNGIFITRDMGATWQVPSTPTDDPGIQNIAVNSGDHNHLLAGTRTGIFESPDCGNTWKSISSRISPSQFFVVEIVSHPYKIDCFVCIYRNETGAAFVAISTDKAMTWKPIRKGFYEDSQPRCICFHPTHSDVLFAGTVMDGVYRTDDLGERWYAINDGLPLDNQLVIIHSMIIVPSEPPVLYAGTNISGAAFKLPVP